jgi:calcineurin-like phosphoesterase family protein
MDMINSGFLSRRRSLPPGTKIPRLVRRRPEVAFVAADIDRRARRLQVREQRREDAMAVYFTSDHHFGHGGARGLYRRPYPSVAAMDHDMIARWNAVVRPEDEVWHLGDFAIRQPAARVAALLEALHGRKHLIAGNNDDAGVTACAGWISVRPYAEVTVDDTNLVLCHYPFRTWRNMGKGWINLHGHSHGRLKPLPRQFDVGVDVRDFQPMRLGHILGGTKGMSA